MSMPLSLFVGVRYTLTTRRSRSVSFISAIAMTGIVLGVALLITVLSVMNGFDRELRERILSILPQITVYQREGLQNWDVVRERLLQGEVFQRQRQPQSNLTPFPPQQAMPNVLAATPFVELQAMLHHRGITQPVLLYGLHEEFETGVSTIHRYLSKDGLAQLSANPNSIAVASSVAEKLKLSVGDNLTIIVPQSGSGQRQTPKLRRVFVSEVFTTGTELDHSLGLMGLSAAADLSNQPDRVSGLNLRVDDFFEAPRVAQQLRTQLPVDFYITDWTRTHGNIYYAIQMSKQLVSLLLFLIIAIASFNVISTLIMVVVDKQSDIAIMRTLGASDSLIMKIFMVQGTVIGCLGTGLGVALGIVLSLSVAYLVAGMESILGIQFLQSDIYPVSFLPSQLRWSDVVLVASVSMVMSFLATWYPARRAAAVAPAEALRYD